MLDEIDPRTVADDVLPPRFREWFAERGWRPRPHQLGLLETVGEGRSCLLIAPTGAGKTLAGFLPSLAALSRRNAGRRNASADGPHTLYVSPLKALAVDIARNLEGPIAEMALPITGETRTGDTPSHKRQRQKTVPPDLLLTTPEQVSLLIASREAGRFFSQLEVVIFDELHSLVTSKRGDLLSLALARLRRHAPDLVTIGLSATVAQPEDLRRWLVGQDGHTGEIALSDLVTVDGGARPDISILDSKVRVPWAGHSSKYAMPEIYEAIREHRTTVLFVNTRSQAELLFQELWRANDDALPIALHHGSLDHEQRRRVEAAMARGELRAVVATSTLDLGLDWGDVDLVVHVGAPKGASRLAQRIGRSNHRMDEPSKGILVPSNRFEVMECRAALKANYIGHQDTPPLKAGALDVLCQHLLAMAVAEPFRADDLFIEVRSAAPYTVLARETFDRALDFAATGGYALRAYERYAKIRERADGTWGITHPRVAQQYRLNAGTIVETTQLKVRYARKAGGVAARGGRVLGQVEEYFIETLTPGDTFMFAGQVLRFEGVRDNEALVSTAKGEDPRIPYYGGSKFPLSTALAQGVREMLADPEGADLPDQVSEWLSIQDRRSLLPEPDQLLVETFPRGRRHYMIAYPFEGRLAHQTLGMLLTRRLERAELKPLGFVATDYALGVWARRDMGEAFGDGRPSLDALFDEDMLGDDLEAWLDDSYLLKRTFRNCAVIAGLIERKYPGQEKTGRQVTVSTDLVYDVLRRHEPDHILLQATRQDAASGLLDIRRLGEMLTRVRAHIIHRNLDRISPLAVPIMLEVGREPVASDADENALREASDALVKEALSF